MLVKFATTNPTLLLNANPLRRRLFLQMQPINVDATNDERIHIGKGFQPSSSVGNPNQGEVLLPGSAIEEMKGFEGDIRPYKGPIWATSSKQNQTMIVEEEVEERKI